jgi:hypothetical protein
LLRDLRCVEQVPLLSTSFESSIPGLYFTGLAGAYNVGPVMRFLSAYAWLRSFQGRKEFDWDDPLPFLIVWARLAIRGVGKIIRIGPFRSNAARQSAGVRQQCKSDQPMPIRCASEYP